MNVPECTCAFYSWEFEFFLVLLVYYNNTLYMSLGDHIYIFHIPVYLEMELLRFSFYTYCQTVPQSYNHSCSQCNNSDFAMHLLIFIVSIFCFSYAGGIVLWVFFLISLVSSILEHCIIIDHLYI